MKKKKQTDFRFSLVSISIERMNNTKFKSNRLNSIKEELPVAKDRYLSKYIETLTIACNEHENYYHICYINMQTELLLVNK